MIASFGYTLSGEEHAPRDLVANAARAEEVGFEFVSISDHFHPWVSAHGHSPFVWSVLGAIAHATARLQVGVGVTCPSVRIHPAVVAQAAATTSLLSMVDSFSGSAPAKHSTSTSSDTAGRRPMSAWLLEEAVDIIRRLWSGDTIDHRGAFYEVENAKLFDPPGELPPIIASAFGPKAIEVAARIGDGYWGHAPDRELLEAFEQAGGTGPRYAQLNLCWAEDAAVARKTVHESGPTPASPASSPRICRPGHTSRKQQRW